MVLVTHFLGWEFPESQTFIFDVLVQWGTLCAVFVYFRQDLTKISSAFIKSVVSGKPFINKKTRIGWYIIIATIPAVVAGLLCKDFIETTFANARVTGIFLLITAILLILAEKIGKRNQSMEDISWHNAWWIGCYQILALLPGVSRSGATIAGGMTTNLDRPSAARFSFLLSVSIMLGAGLLAFKDLLDLPVVDSFLGPLVVGFLFAFISGYFAIRWLIAYLIRNSLSVFATYCLLLGVFSAVSI